jgi:hypothetical protein
MRLPPFAFSCLLLFALALTAFADPIPPTSLRPDIIYTHRGEFVQVKPMRPLTLNAHVAQFTYDPLGLEIAYVGSEPQGEDTVHFVKTIDARTGHELSRLTVTAPKEDKSSGFLLRGWSVSGKYLLLQRSSPDPSQPETVVNDFLRWDLSTNPPTAHTINLQASLPSEGQSADLAGSADCYPSPSGRWLVFTQSIHTQAADGKPGPDQNSCLLYDPEHDTFRLLNLPPKTIFDSWADNGHLKIWQDGKRKQLDVVTGQISPRPEDTKLDPPAASAQYPDLSLDTEQRNLNDAQNSGGHVSSYIVWIRRTPFGKIPLGAAAAALMPSRRENDGLENNGGMWNTFKDPQAVWSPTGKQVALIANDDLCVTDLVSVSNGMPKEKMAVGLSLTCADEQALAMADLKQIGLGLIQFTQDNDEKYPTAGDFMAKVYPYIKTMDVFSVGGHEFVYEQPGDTLASVDSPATTENGYMDLPCARIVLFADGHVKAFPKQETAP